MSTVLTHAVIAYQENGENWSRLSEQINQFVYRFPFKHTNWEHDRCCDFYMSFLPKIPRLVRRYRPISAFESYLYTCLKWYMKTFTERLAAEEHYEAWTVNESTRVMENQAEYHPSQRENNPLPDCPLGIDEEGRLCSKVLRRRILTTILVFASDIEIEKIPALAVLTGVDPTWLETSLEYARGILSERIVRRNKLRERLNECWYNMEWTRKRMETDGIWDENACNRWAKKYHFWRKRHELARRTLFSLQLRLSLKEVGQILNLPTGTVASGLYLLRKQWCDTMDGG